jgi:hypothetical protein
MRCSLKPDALWSSSSSLWRFLLIQSGTNMLLSGEVAFLVGDKAVVGGRAEGF